MSRVLSRRAVLRGAGVALALPWMESLAPREARAQAAEPRRTFVAFSFPCGVTKFWKPAAPGAGDAWALSPLLLPLAPLKSHLTVLGNVGNLGPFGGHIEPSHSYLNAAFLTCAKVKTPFVTGSTSYTLGPSVDQVLAKGIAGKTRLSSLQVGLSTTASFQDGLPSEFSRCISWASETEPLAKVISPQAVFDAIVAAGPLPTAPSTNPDVFASARRAANKSVLDFVAGHATSVRAKLGRADQAKLDVFLDSVRELEKRVDRGGSCAVLPRPSETWIQTTEEASPPGYDRDAHANLMMDLVLMALRCDVTRVVSFMFDDSRSDFDYTFLKGRTFDAPGATPLPAGSSDFWGLHALQNTSETNAQWSIVIRWFVEKLARFCAGLKAIDEGTGTMLDNATVWFGSEMNGANHSEVDMPVLYVGGAGGRLRTNRYIDFAQTPRMTERLANVYLTFLRHVFDLPVTTFGSGTPKPGEPLPHAYGAGTELVPEIIAP
jgi:hypothetical protein